MKVVGERTERHNIYPKVEILCGFAYDPDFGLHLGMDTLLTDRRRAQMLQDMERGLAALRSVEA